MSPPSIDRERHRRRVAVTSIVWVWAAMVALAGLVVAMWRDTSWNWWVWNSDALTPYLVAGDVLGGGSFGAWHMAHSAYLFPDVVVSALGWLVSGGGAAGVVVVGVLQVVAVVAATAVLAGASGVSGIDRRRPAPGRLATGRVTSTCAAAAVTLVVFAVGVVAVREPFVLVVANGHHTGACVAGLVVLVRVWTRVRSGRVMSWVEIAVLMVWCGAAALSDLLFVAQAALPLAVWLVLAGRCAPSGMRRGVWVRPLAGVMSGSLAGVLVAPMVVPNWERVPGGLSFDGAPGRLADLVEVMVFGQGLPVSGGVVGVAALVVNVACAVWVVGVMWRVVRRRASAGVVTGALGVVAVWIGGAWWVMTGLVAVTSSFPVAERYLLVAWWGPVVFAVVWLAGRGWVGSTDGVGVAVSGVVAVAAVAVLGVSVWVAPVTGAPWLPGTPELACVGAALDAAGAESVVVQYWDAKVFAVHLGGDVRFAQHTADGAEYRFATSGAFFDPDHRYDGIIVSAHAGPAHAVDPEAVIAGAGVPAGDATCGPWRVLTYGAGGLMWGDR